MSSCLIVASTSTPSTRRLLDGVLIFTQVLGGYGEASTVLLCVADTFKQRPRLQKAYPRVNRAARYAFALAFFGLRVGYWSVWIVPYKGPSGVRLGLYALLGLQYYWGFCILKKVARSIDRCPSSSKLIR